MPSIDILDLLRLAGEVRLLKLDCEGSEWPILWRADLSRVRAIAMEWHAAWLDGIEALTGERYSIDALVARLADQGFKVESIVNPEAPKLGHLFACR